MAPGSSAYRVLWALLAAAVLASCLGLWLLPAAGWGAGRVRGGGNGWGGLLALAAALGYALLLHRRLALPWAEMGLVFAQRPASLRLALAVSALALALHACTLPAAGAAAVPVAAQTWLYQATLPGLVEEVLFRGVVLALADRAWPPCWTLAGIRFGWGAVALTAVFVALHASSAVSLLSSLAAAMLFLWLRAYTGSLLLPVLVHNAWNLLVLAAAS